MFYIVRCLNKQPVYLKNHENIKEYLLNTAETLPKNPTQSRILQLYIDSINNNPPPSITFWEKPKGGKKPVEKKEKKPRVVLTPEEKMEKLKMELEKIKERMEKKKEQLKKEEEKQKKKLNKTK